MPVPGKAAFAVVAGGVALGTMLGAAANPVMKQPPEQPWRGGLQAPVSADPGYRIMIEAPPEDLSPYQDSYAPTWAREELTDWEPDYPAWTYSDIVDEDYAEPSEAQQAASDAQQVAAAAQAAAAPQVGPGQVAPPADPASQAAPADPASYPRIAANLDDLY